MKQAGWSGGCTGVVRRRFADDRSLGRSGRGSKNDRRLELDLARRLSQLRELEAALQDLGCGGRGKLKRAGVPALKLRQAAASADLRLQRAQVALRIDDPRLHVLKL